jgi:hypothetical protein
MLEDGLRLCRLLRKRISLLSLSSEPFSSPHMICGVAESLIVALPMISMHDLNHIFKVRLGDVSSSCYISMANWLLH